ncbi:MAG: hypothetical protein ACKVWV_18085 [Planctomycetota bacterium]
MIKTPCLRVLALTLAATSASAQSDPPFPFWLQNKVRWPNELGSCARITRSVAGEFTHDGIRSAVTLGGDTVCFVYGPFAHVSTAAVPFPGPVNDIDTLTQGGVDRRDAVVGVGSFGLVTSFLLGTDPDEFASDEAILGAWQGARMVRSRNINADGSPDFVGVAADGKTVIVRQNTIGSNTFVESTFSCFQPEGSSSEVHDVVLAQWDFDADLEIALRTDHGLEVYDKDGTPRRKHATPGHHGDAIVAFQGVPGGPEVIAWLVTNAAQNGQDLYASRGTIVPPLQYQGALTFGDGVTMASADANADGRGDLVVARRGTYRPYLLRNSAESTTGPYFAGCTAPTPSADFGVLTLGGSLADPEIEQPADVNEALPLWTDFSNDGIPDLYVPIETSNTFAILDGAATPQSPGMTLLTTDLFHGDRFEPAIPAGSERTLRLMLHFDDVPSNATDLELWAFLQPSLDTSTFLEPSAEISLRYDIDDPASPGVYHVLVPVPPHASDTQCELQRVYWIGVRFTRRSAENGALLQAFPHHYAVFTTDGEVLEHWITTPPLGGTTGFLPTVEGCYDGLDISFAGGTTLRPVPGLMERHALPPTQTGRVPKVPGNPPPPPGNTY